MSPQNVFAHGSARQRARRRYALPGLDGLRALAVTLVLIYHFWPHVMPGGLVGVDVFFVISGFLITGLLLKEGAANGKIALKDFWIRRFRRLVPAVLLVVLVTVPIAALIGGDVLAGMRRQVIGAVTYTTNWLSIFAGNDYFTQQSPEMMTHLWSLAIEEQFYVVWPILLTVILVLVRHRLGRQGVVIGLALVSLLWMWLQVNTFGSPSRAYYGLDTHAFGLMLGAALAVRHPDAFYPPERPRPHRWSGLITIGAWLGLAGTVAVGLFVSDKQPELMQPWGLLAATLCTLLVIRALLADVHPGRKGALRTVLGLAPLTWIGKRSYGLYLWHWPIAVLLHYSNLELPSLVSGLVAAALTVAFAAASHRYVEEPIRRHGFINTFRGITRTGPSATMRWSAITGGALALALGGCVTQIATTAPTMTEAQQFIEEGRKAAEQAKEQAAQNRPTPQPTDIPTGNPTDGSGEAPGGDPTDEATDAPTGGTTDGPTGGATDAPTDAPTNDDGLAPGQTPPGEDILFIGDSVGAAATPTLLEEFPGIDVDADISRLFPYSVKQVKERAANGTLPRYVVIAMATNGTITMQQVDDVLAAAGPDRDIFLVTGHAPEDRAPWVAEANKTIHDAAQKYDNVYMVDWNARISDKEEFLAEDRIHPGPGGSKILCDAIREQLINAAHE